MLLTVGCIGILTAVIFVGTLFTAVRSGGFGAIGGFSGLAGTFKASLIIAAYAVIMIRVVWFLLKHFIFHGCFSPSHINRSIERKAAQIERSVMDFYYREPDPYAVYEAEERKREADQAVRDRTKAANDAVWHQSQADRYAGTYDGYVHQNQADDARYRANH